MKGKVLVSIVSLTVLSLCVLCISSCNGNNSDSDVTANIPAHIEANDIFINKVQPLNFGYVSCYTNPQNVENPENEENSYGIMDSEGNVIIEPEYADAFPVSRETFAVSTVEDGKNYSSMIDSSGNIIISSFKGEIVAVAHEDNAAIAIVEPQGEKSYIVDMTGKKLLDRDFNSIFIASETKQDVLEAYTDESAYYISLDGKLIAELPADKPVLDPFGEGEDGAVIACCYSPQESEGRILYGLYDSKSGYEIVPCARRNGFSINENRFIFKDTSAMGPDYGDFAAIYDKNGNIICGDGKYQDIIFSYGSSVGVGVTIKPTEDGMGSEVKYYRIDADGNALSKAFDTMPESDK